MADKIGIVIPEKLNVRSGQGTDFPVIMQLYSGTSVKILAAANDWKEIDISSLKGYVNRSQVILSNPEKDNILNLGIVDAEALNIRAGQGYEFPVTSIINRGTTVEIIEEFNEWLHIRTRLLRGFIQKNLIVEIYGKGPIAEGSYYAAINEDLVNLRNGSGLNFPVIAVLLKDTELKVTRSTSDWVQVETVIYEGFIRKEFVKRNSSDGIIYEDTNAISTAIATNDDILLHAGPDSNYQIIASLKSGIQLKVLDIASDWLRVELFKQPAFVSDNYIREISSPIDTNLPNVNDPLQPNSNEFIFIADNFSNKQRQMAQTWNSYGGLISEISEHLGLDPTVSLAVFCVESGGQGFGSDGRLIIRFENHYFYRIWGESNRTLYDRHFRFDSNISWKNHEFRPNVNLAWEPVHTGRQENEWRAFELACLFDRDSALNSISMGSPQIMGANHRTLNYSSAEHMFNEFQSDIRFQITGFFNFIKGKNIIHHLISEDFIEFASQYNGPANANDYGEKIEDYVEAFRQIWHD